MTDFQCRLASFDLDGTLVPGISSGAFLADRLGHGEQMRAAEARYARGEVGNDFVSRFDGSHYLGLTKAQIFDLLADMPQIRHIGVTVAALAECGIPSVICTLAWEFVAEYLALEHGFVAWSGPALGYDAQGRFTGAVVRHFSAGGKPEFIAEQCRQRGISLHNVVHVGDSHSDLALFRQVGLAIALNATDDARALAQVRLDSDSLLDILPLIPNLGSAR